MKMFGFVGSSGSGKTTLIVALLPELRRRGLRVSTLKHAHHGFDMDRAGKDSHRHREAGAEEVMVVSDGRWALLRERHADEDVSLGALAERMAPVDILLVEGFKQAGIAKIEVYRPSIGKPPLFPGDGEIVAVASDAAVDVGERPLLPLSPVSAVADFIVASAG